VNLTRWAHAQGIHVQTAYRWYRERTLPLPAPKVGRVTVVCPETDTGVGRRTEGAGLLALVSSHELKSGLDGQVARLPGWAAKAGLLVTRMQAEAGSGMNESRVKVRQILAGPAVTVVVVGHRDRLARMNTELAEAAPAAHNRRLAVLDDYEVSDDPVGDMAEVLTSFCARLYGRRSARNRALGALGWARQDIRRRAVKLQRCGGGV
jgi:putative resolvase